MKENRLINVEQPNFMKTNQVASTSYTYSQLSQTVQQRGSEVKSNKAGGALPS